MCNSDAFDKVIMSYVSGNSVPLARTEQKILYTESIRGFHYHMG